MALSRALKEVERPKTAKANKGQCVDTNEPGSRKAKSGSNKGSTSKKAGKAY